jgi:hypothetical protein
LKVRIAIPAEHSEESEELMSTVGFVLTLVVVLAVSVAIGLAIANRIDR